MENTTKTETKSTETRRAEFWPALLAAIRAAGAETAETLNNRTCLVVDGVRVYCELSEERMSSSFRSIRSGNGRLRFILGDYGDKRQWPEPKAGFDYAKLAGEIIAAAKRAKATRDRRISTETCTKQNAAVARALNLELGLSEMRVNSFDPSLSHEHHTTKFYAEGTSYGPASGVHLVLPDMSADKARAVLAFLKTLEVA